MLVLSRRENDRIDFPALGISVEVMRLTRSRAALGIVAPKGIRVVRHELLQRSGIRPTSEGLAAAVRQHLTSQIQGEIEVATAKLKAAQEELEAGNTEDALAALGQALAELDALRSGVTGRAIEQSRPGSSDPARSDSWSVSGGVAESNAGYATATRDGAGPEDPSASASRVLWFGDPGGEGTEDREAVTVFESGGIRVHQTRDPMVVFYELSRQLCGEIHGAVSARD